MLALVALIVSAIGTPVPVPKTTKTPFVVAANKTVASPVPLPSPLVVAPVICQTISKNARLRNSIQAENPPRFLSNVGSLLVAAMTGHLKDADLAKQTPKVVDEITLYRGSLELFGSGRTAQFPSGVIGCLLEYK